MQFHRILFFLLFGLICGKIFGQLSLEINPITEVLVGGGFQVSGRIVHDANSSNITAGTPIQLDIEIQDPSGNPIATNPTQIFSGGFSGGQVQTYTQSFQMPWSEDDKWTAAARWRVVVEVNGGGSPQGNITFPLRIPDLSIASVNAPTTATPGSYVTLGGIISNRITATEPQSFFRVEASIVGSNITESIIFPDPANFPINSNWPVEANADLNFFIPNFFIPETATDPIQVNIQVDPANPDIIPEENPNNNSFNHTINIVTGDSNIGATVFFDAVGTYQGLDPIKFKLVARNTGTAAVANADNFNLTVVLSEDNQFSTDDYILRQIDVGGGANGLGSGLLPNETITVNWVQMLPDNFEGDFYVLVRLNNGNNPIFASLTPEISLRSEETVGFASVTDNQTGRSTRPATSDDGKWVTFESMANGFNQIFLYNFVTDQTTLVTQGLDNLPADGDSYAPDISGDGRYVVFHSFASNLVNGDKNRHSDVFIYNVYSSYLAKVSNGVDGPDANEGSFYPCIDQNGTHVAFESEATNIDLKVSSSGGRQIYLFDHNTTNGSGENNQITHGNGDSFDASMDDNGSRIVFTTFADNLVQSETDTNGYSDVILWDEKVPSTFFFVARSQKGELPEEGDTKEPVISGNGEIIAFVSSGTNMVSGKGIAHIKIHEQGLGYSVIDVVNIDDTEGNGTGAEASLIVDAYGAVQEIVIDNPGRDYVKPSLSISSSSREVNATATPYLVNLQGDIFRISTQSVKNKGVSSRVSESKKINGLIGSEYGGNERSREPSIDRNGRHIAFSTMASNLLDLNLTSTSKKVFPNLTFRPATAQAVLHGGIGKIIIANPGSGYPASGNFLIQDLSGNGSGAVASYQVDSNGGIGSITIINAGSGYDLSQTIVSIQNPGTGTGFQVAQLLFPAVSGTGANRTGGASVQRIEMIDPGIGYPQSLHQSMQTPEILVDGDGVDTDNDGQADSKINSDRIHFGQNGEVYLEQHFEISLNNLSQLPSTTLEITDQLRMARGMPSLILSFDNAQFPPPFTISTSDNNLTSIRNKVIDMINSQWTDPQNLFEGPQIDHNLSGGTTFSLKALSGRVMSNNPTALGVKHLSNMLIQGSGFSRATAQITPSPVIHGFSELSPGMNTTAAGNGRPLFQFQPDVLTDDIYLYDHDTTRNQRISVSKFGFPTNFLSGANMPSHRFPSLSQDARYVFFSSDAGGQGGIIFNDSNQDFNPDNNRRDIFVRDMKSHALFNDNASISISEEILNATNHKINLNSEYPILISGEIKEGSIASVALYVNGQEIANSLPNQSGSQAFNLFSPWTPSVTGSHVLIAEIMDNLGNKYVSEPVLVTVIETKGIVTDIKFEVYPFQAFDRNVTNGSSLTSQAKFIGRDGRQPTLSKVTFFLNGKKLSEQTQPPYKQIFEPPSLHDDGKSVSFRWALTALAEDTKGNSFLGTEYGQNQFSEIMPVMQIDLVNGISGLNQNQILDGQVVTIDGEIVGSHEELLNVQNIIFTANGIVFADSGQPNEVQVSVIRTSTNNIFRITNGCN